MDGARDDPPQAPHAEQSLGEIGLSHFPPYLMNRIMGRYNADLAQRLKPHGLSTAQMRTLAVLAVVPGLTINALAVYAVTEQSTMSRTLEAMERQGLVRRTAREDDARMREIHLTDAGRALFAEVWPEMHAAYGALFAGVGEAERAAFVRTLQRMLQNIRRHPI